MAEEHDWSNWLHDGENVAPWAEYRYCHECDVREFRSWNRYVPLDRIVRRG